MGISEAFIIYLAIGAPLGVYAIIRAKTSVKKNLVGLLAANILFWPIFASLEFVPSSETSQKPDHFVDFRSNSTDDFENASSSFYAFLEHISDRSARRSAREAFERFTAFYRAVSDTDAGSSSIPEIFKLAAHKNPAVAAKCLHRKNSAKLKDHLRRAGTDLYYLADELPFPDRSRFKAVLAKTEIKLGESSVS